MEHVQAGLRLRIFRLPACVDAEALWVVRAEMSHGRPDDACVLDFSRTRHIRFQDLRDFARSARRWLDAARPVFLLGLNDYCERIVLYALEAQDWDRFRLVGESGGMAPDGGNAGAVPWRFESSRREDVLGTGGLGGLPVPSLN